MANVGEGDKRKVSTDALETLGTILSDKERRDAIHLAVEPVVAGSVLLPGQHVSVKDGVAYPAPAHRGLGIVDPFLTRGVEQGERFWFVMYPRQVHSLRHVWTHPAFADEPVADPIHQPAWSRSKVCGSPRRKPRRSSSRADGSTAARNRRRGSATSSTARTAPTTTP